MNDNSDTKSTFLADMNWRMLLLIATTGLIVGAIIWGLTYVISRYAIPRLICDMDSTVLICSQTTVFASNLATIFGALIGVLILLKLRVFRPLLIVVVTAIALWSIETWTKGGQWYEPLLWSAALYSIGYATFAWLARVQFLRVALIAIALVVVMLRILPSLI